jgi:hypothetical protein
MSRLQEQICVEIKEVEQTLFSGKMMGFKYVVTYQCEFETGCRYIFLLNRIIVKIILIC